MKRVSLVFVFLSAVLMISCAHKSGHKNHILQTQGECVLEDSFSASDSSRSISDSDDLLSCILKDDKNTRLLERDGYVVMYSTDTHCPVYVGWVLTRDRADGDVERCKTFFPDQDIAETDRVTNADYKRSGWSKGHMCPAADNKDSELRMKESCLLTNICPQDMRLNSGRWNDLENRCRNLARKGYVVYVVCGPVFTSSSNDWIGENVQIAIPDSFFKVMYIVNEDSGVQSMEAYIMPNEQVTDNLSAFSVSVDDVENITGLDFFYALPDNVEDWLEKHESY
ncbi:MAG: DNA/RNA non-specific endonuclease [Prevotellaceae bacterium]|nr:DNA/RNA non-specific endonuclease [Candidatus Minthosoma equi]